jgi:hypothetical protein
MRKIESRILDAIAERRIGIVKLSKRDYVETTADSIDVTLWSTTIAKIYTDRVVVNSGGWHTATTKSRLNAILGEYCNMGIGQIKREWYITNLYSAQRKWLSFGDGMSLARTASSTRARSYN